jgi:hypothetical protein
MLQPKDRQYAGLVAAIIVAGKVIRGEPLSPDTFVQAAGSAVQVLAAVDRHLPPKSKDRPKGRRRP